MKLAFVALLAMAPAASQAAVVISFSHAADVDAPAFSGTLTIDTSALGVDLVGAPNTLYKSPARLFTLKSSSGVTLPGAIYRSVIYSNATDQDPAIDPDGDYSYGGAFTLYADDGSANGAVFTLFNSDGNAPKTPSTAQFGGVLLPDFRNLQSLYLTLSSGSNNVNGAVTVTGYAETLQAVPEPGTWVLMAGGLGLVGAALRRRRTAVSFG